MVPGNPERFEPGIALGMAPHDNHGPIQDDIGTFVEGHQACGHFRVLAGSIVGLVARLRSTSPSIGNYRTRTTREARTNSSEKHKPNYEKLVAIVPVEQF
jgi:hypothetical protein